MNDITTARMLLTTAVMAAVAALFAGGANAMLLDVEGGGSGSPAVAAPGASLPHGIMVGASQSSGQTSLGLTGDSPRTRMAPESVGLTGDSPIGRFPGTTQTAVASGGDDLDWSSFGAGAGLVALVGAGIAGVWLTTRRRGGVALP